MEIDTAESSTIVLGRVGASQPHSLIVSSFLTISSCVVLELRNHNCRFLHTVIVSAKSWILSWFPTVSRDKYDRFLDNVVVSNDFWKSRLLTTRYCRPVSSWSFAATAAESSISSSFQTMSKNENDRFLGTVAVSNDFWRSRLPVPRYCRRVRRDLKIEITDYLILSSCPLVLDIEITDSSKLQSFPTISEDQHVRL
jgi:hypothetical protein